MAQLFATDAASDVNQVVSIGARDCVWATPSNALELVTRKLNPHPVTTVR